MNTRKELLAPFENNWEHLEDKEKKGFDIFNVTTFEYDIEVAKDFIIAKVLKPAKEVSLGEVFTTSQAIVCVVGRDYTKDYGDNFNGLKLVPGDIFDFDSTYERSKILINGVEFMYLDDSSPLIKRICTQ